MVWPGGAKSFTEMQPLFRKSCRCDHFENAVFEATGRVDNAKIARRKDPNGERSFTSFPFLTWALARRVAPLRPCRTLVVVSQERKTCCKLG